MKSFHRPATYLNKKSMVFFLALISIVSLQSLPAVGAVSLQTQAWTRAVGGINTSAGKAATTDANGNIYVIGAVSGTSVDFSSAGDVYTGTAKAFLMRINADGSYAWTRAFGTGGTVSANDVATDSAGNVYVTGAFSGTVNFSVNGTQTLTASGGGSFLTRFNGSGAYLGTTSVGGRAMSIAIDQSDNIYVAKSTSYSAGTAVAISLAKYNTSGALVATHALNGYANYGHDGKRLDGNDGMLAVDSAGNIYVTGVFSGTVLFGGTDSRTSTALSPFLTRINANFTYGWTWTPGNTSNNLACVGDTSGRYNCAPWGHQAVAVDNAGHVYLAGWFNDVLDLGDGNAHLATKSISSGYDATCSCYLEVVYPMDDAFVAQFNAADGSYAGWSQIIDDSYLAGGTVSAQDIRSLNIDGDGNAYISGVGGWDSVLVARINADHTVNILNSPYTVDHRGDISPYTTEDPTSVLGPDNALYVTSAYIRTVDFGNNDVLTSSSIYSPTLAWNGWENSNYTYYSNFYLSRYATVGAVTPTANAGSDQTHDGGATVTLDATGSGPMVDYEWTQTGGPTVALSNNHSPTPTFAAPRVTSNTPLYFDLRVRNNDGLWSAGSDTVMITVTPNLYPPVAAPDAYTVDKNLSLSVSGNVLANDTDGDGDTLTVVSHTNPAHGTLTIGSNGSFTYTVTATYFGTSDSFTYDVMDGAGGVPVQGTVSITIIQPPMFIDLNMTNVSSTSTSVVPGAKITISNTVRNSGDTAVGSFQVGLYLSTDSTITTGDRLIATRTVTSLAAATNNTASTSSVTIPSDTVAGTYYLGAIADYTDAIPEDIETNNSLAGTTLTVKRPDLTVTNMTAPASAGRGMAISVTTTEKNQGTQASVTNYVKLYLSSDATITGSDTYLGQYSQLALAVGASASKALSVTIPAATPPGNYYLGAIADATATNAESDESNNTYSRPITIIIPVDLTVTAMSAPASAGRGLAISVTTTEKNQGIKASASNYVKLYLSSDAAITSTDTYLGQYSQAAIAAGASVNHTMSVTIPAATAAGSYYLGAIADATNTNPESNEANNTFSVPINIYVPTPDLTVTAVNGGPATVAQKGTLTLTGTVKNVGTRTPGATSYAGFYLSDGITDTFLKQLSVGATLAIGASVNLSTTYTLPAGFPAGTYSVKLIADRTGVISEIDETNNSMTGNSVTVLP